MAARGRGHGSEIARGESPARGRRAGRATPSAEARALLAARVRERLPGLEAGLMTRASAIADPREVADPTYAQRLREALRRTVEHSLAGLENGGNRPPEPDDQVLAQARLDARVKVPLDVVLRRHVAAEALLGDVLTEEALQVSVSADLLRRLQGEAATRLDHLLTAVGEVYAEEARSRSRGGAERRRDYVKRLLAGEFATGEVDLAYDLEGFHLAVMVEGEGGEALLRALAGRCDRRLLVVQREEEPTWAGWLGGTRPLSSARVLQAFQELDLTEAVAAVGEPAELLDGWRFTHLQAKAALPIARARGGPVRFAEVTIETALRRDELIATSLRRLYLEPLGSFADGGAVARETLVAWFACERNITATAASLGVDRRTVRNRLRSIEARIERPLAAAALDLELALRLAR
jgi:hypothetical protein